MKFSTLKDISKLAKVSVGTVDRVIHNRGKVSEKSLKKVNDVLKQIEYVPNVFAKSLKKHRVLQIVILVPHIENDDYWKQVNQGIQQFEREYKGFGITTKVSTFSSEYPDLFLQTAETAIKERPDGFLIAPVFHHESIEIAQKISSLNIPLIIINNEIEEITPLSFIGQNLFESAQVAGNLIDQCSNNLRDVFILNILDAPSNASYLDVKVKGVRRYFQDRQVRVSDIKIEKPYVDLNYIRENDVSENPGFLITTSKSYLVVPEIRRQFPSSVIVGYDLIPQNIKLLKNKSINFLINQNPARMSYEGLLRFAEKFLFSKDTAPCYYLPIDIITSENIQSHLNNIIKAK